MIYTKSDIPTLNEVLKTKDAREIIAFFIDKLGDKLTFGTSLGAEDQVITQMIASISKEATIFTLDTGRLFAETYDLIDRTTKKYNIKIHPYFPAAEEVEDMVMKHGINLFYNSIDLRHQCCQIRKLNPLKRAMNGKEAWITGLRRSQSITRTTMQIVEWDDNSKKIKINPLINWSEKEVWDYIKAHHIPYNPLHDKGFPSIGCQPCTRAIMEGEDLRAGRWWWENPDTKECGLHK